MFAKEYVTKGFFDKELYSKFTNSQTLRQEADYDAFISFNQKVAKEQIYLAEIFYEKSIKLL